jgi:hypothetical protein
VLDGTADEYVATFLPGDVDATREEGISKGGKRKASEEEGGGKKGSKKAKQTTLDFTKS